MAKTRRNYTGGAAATTTVGIIGSSGTTSFSVTSSTGWPYGSAPFFVVVEPGTANEEKLLVTRTGSSDTSLNVYSTPTVDANRGLDGTVAAAHAAGSAIYPVFTALDADEANELASTLTSKGDLLTHGASTFARVGVGSNNHVLVADSAQSAGLKWAQVGSDNLASDAVTTAKILDANVTANKLASNAVTTAKIGDGQVTAAKIASGVLVPEEIVFTISGTLSTGARKARYYVESGKTISNVVVSVGTAPTGASAIFDVNKNGTTIFTTQANRPTITASNFYDSSSTPDVTSLSAGDYLTVDVDQVGSTVKGEDAVIKIVFG